MPDAMRKPGPAMLIVFALMAGVGARLYWAQTVLHHDGGPISPQKAVWFALAVTLFIWMPVFFMLDRRVALVLRRILSVHVILWILRAGAELWLMYGVHLWIPPYGVIHNVTSFLLLSFLMARHRPEVQALTDPPSLNAIRYTRIMRFAMVCECVFAEMFFYTVNMDTTHTWFANTEPRFWLINMLTIGADVILLPLLALTARDYYRGDRPQPAGGSIAS